MSQADPDVNPDYPDSPRYDESGEVESSTDENAYVGPRPLARWEEDEDGYQNVHVDEFMMENRLRDKVAELRHLIEFYDLKKGINYKEKNSWRMKGYYQLLYALMRLEHDMDPDFAWYEKRMSFENGYGASIICKPVSNGGDAQMFEIAVLKFGRVCDDTPVSYNLEGYLDFEDVIKVLHEIRELPPAEEDEPKQGHIHWSDSYKKMKKRMEEDKKNGREEIRLERFKKYETEIAKKNLFADPDFFGQYKSSKGPEQEEENPYEVPTGPVSI